MSKKKLLIKKEKKAVINGRERVISGFEKHYADAGKDFHTKHGVIKAKEMSKKPGSATRINNHEFIILDPVFLDHYKRIRRMAQIITLKDIGALISNTGITKDSVVMDAGSGSGALACYMAALAKKVISYDIDKDNLELAAENARALGLKNLVFKHSSIYSANKIDEKDVDVFILDVPEPAKALRTARKVLKTGGFLAVYLPNINQVQELVCALPGEFLLEKTVELIEREWDVGEKKARPRTKDHSHTAFLTFARKLR